jgi:hypothetical protein
LVELDLTNLRIKDFYDIWLLSHNLEFQGKVSAEAIKSTFVKRQTSLPADAPNALTARFAGSEAKVNQWKAFLRKNRLDPKLI